MRKINHFFLLSSWQPIIKSYDGRKLLLSAQPTSFFIKAKYKSTGMKENVVGTAHYFLDENKTIWPGKCPGHKYTSIVGHIIGHIVGFIVRPSWTCHGSRLGDHFALVVIYLLHPALNIVALGLPSGKIINVQFPLSGGFIFNFSHTKFD